MKVAYFGETGAQRGHGVNAQKFDLAIAHFKNCVNIGVGGFRHQGHRYLCAGQSTEGPNAKWVGQGPAVVVGVILPQRFEPLVPAGAEFLYHKNVGLFSLNQVNEALVIGVGHIHIGHEHLECGRVAGRFGGAEAGGEHGEGCDVAGDKNPAVDFLWIKSERGGQGHPRQSIPR